jgi:hypothetical protein
MNAIFKALNDVTGGNIRTFESQDLSAVKLRIISIFQNQYFTSFGHFEACDLITFEKTVNSSFILLTTVMEDVLQWITLKNKK